MTGPLPLICERAQGLTHMGTVTTELTHGSAWQGEQLAQGCVLVTGGGGHSSNSQRRSTECPGAGAVLLTGAGLHLPHATPVPAPRYHLLGAAAGCPLGRMVQKPHRCYSYNFPVGLTFFKREFSSCLFIILKESVYG